LGGEVINKKRGSDFKYFPNPVQTGEDCLIPKRGRERQNAAYRVVKSKRLPLQESNEKVMDDAGIELGNIRHRGG